MLQHRNSILFVCNIATAIMMCACTSSSPERPTSTQSTIVPLNSVIKQGGAIHITDFSNNGIEGVEPGCDLSPISAGPLSIEGTSDSDPNRVFLNEQFQFEPGLTFVDLGGRTRTSVNIFETMEMGFYRNWLSDGVSALASQVASGLSSSCSNIVGAPNSGLISYVPPIGQFQIGVTKRVCAVIDLPCGLPETECHGGRLCCPPEVPVCTIRQPMCRTEQSTDIFSASAIMGFQFNLSIIGEVPDQQVAFDRIMTQNDVSTSSGDLFNLFNDIGLARIFGLRIGDFENTMRQTINEGVHLLQSGGAAFKIPIADWIYLPKATKVSWSSPTNKPPAASPIGIVVKREMRLPTDLACKVISCIKQSKDAGKLLLDSCNL